MAHTEHVVRGTQASEHFVQLFDSTESLTTSVARFLIEAHAAGDQLLVVAREPHWIGMHRLLSARGIDVSGEIQSGRLVVMNAATKLAELTRMGVPHQGLFDEAVGEPVRALAARGRLSI